MFAAESDDNVSERELLILTVLSYSNKQTLNQNAILTAEFLNQYGLNSKMIHSDEISNWKVVDYEINDNNVKSGFSVYTFQKGNNIVIIPRGTDGGVISENWRYLASNEHPQAKYMESYIRKLVPLLSSIKECKLYLCGHSLGGYLALYGTGVILQFPELHECFAKTVTFNGLGLGKHTNPAVLSELYKIEKNKIVNYRINGDIVSYFGNHITISISLNLINSPLIKRPKSGWYLLPSANSHNLAQFFFHDPFLIEWAEEKETDLSNISTKDTKSAIENRKISSNISCSTHSKQQNLASV